MRRGAESQALGLTEWPVSAAELVRTSVAAVTGLLQSLRDGGRVYRWAVAALIALGGVMLMLALPLGTVGFVSQAFAGSACVYVHLRRDRREWAVVALCAAAYGGLYVLCGARIFKATGWQVCLPAGFAGLAGLIVVLCRCAWETGPARKELLRIAGALALLPALCWGSAIAVLLDIRITPFTYDRVLYVFDQRFVGAVGFALGQFLNEHVFIEYLCALVYNCLPVTLSILLALQAKDRMPGTADVRKVFIALGVAGFLLYHLCPAAGPIHLVGKAFPYHPVSAAAFLAMPAPMGPSARNAVPSLHVAWSLVALASSLWRRRWTKIYCAFALLFTAVATVGLGEHYLIDLIVAFPLAAAVQLGCSGLQRNLAAVLLCSGITLAWLAALRTGAALSFAAPPHSWVLAAITIALPTLLTLVKMRQSRCAAIVFPGSRCYSEAGVD